VNPSCQLDNSLNDLITYIQNIGNVFFDTPLFLQVVGVAGSYIIDKLWNAPELQGSLYMVVGVTAFDTVFEIVLQDFFVFVVLEKSACICTVMRKGKIICHIMYDFSELPPVYTLLTLCRIPFYQVANPFFDVIKGSVEFMFLCQKGWLDIRKDTSQTKCLSVRLKTLFCHHLIRQISG
jgi:hypothetical protein